MQQKTERLVYIDVAKGIGIILVVLIHIIFSSDSFNDLSYIRNYIYAFHMPLFFIISGYCLFQKYHDSQQIIDVKHALYRLCKKFLPCYFLWSIIYIFLLKATNQPVDIMERIRVVITTKGIAPLWFIITLFLCEFFFVIAHKYLMKRKSFYYCFFVILVLLTLLSGSKYESIIAALNNKSILGISVPIIILVLFRFITCLTMLYAGYLLGDIFEKISINKLAAFIGSLISIGLMCYAVAKTQNYVNLHLFQMENPGIFMITSILGSLGIILLSYAVQIHAHWLAFIGRYSLGIMIIHYMPLRIMEYAGKLSFMVTSSSYLAVFLTLLITLGCCGCIIFVINKKFYMSNSKEQPSN
jgi:fucose 4-O-acetylase-like acetyltransferase